MLSTLKFIRRNKALILIFFVVLVVFLELVPLGPYVANDFPFISQKDSLGRFGLPQAWSRISGDLGEYSVATLWAWPLDILGGLVTKAGFNFIAMEFVVFIIPSFALSVICVGKIFDKYGIKDPGRFIGSFFYATSTYFLLLIDGGQLSIALAYAIFPLVYLLFLNSIGSSFKKKLISGVGISILGYLNIIFVYILGLLILIRFLYLLFLEKRRIKIVHQFFKSCVFAGVVIFLFHAYWILPLALVKANFIPAAYDTTVRNFTSLYNSLTFLQPNWYLNVFGKISPLRIQFIFIPILVFLSPLIKRRDKTVGFWIVVAIVSIFLAKGSSPPLGGVYLWLYSKVPGFMFFRDSTKFFFLVSLSYSILLGKTVNEISKNFRLFSIFVAIYLLFLIIPLYTGKMTGIFSKPRYEESFLKIAKKFEEDRSFGRVFWIPTRSFLGYADPEHPSAEAMRLVLQRPFAIGTVGTYEVFNFLREASFIGQILEIASIKYLVYPYPDTKRENLVQDNVDYYYTFLSQLISLPWVEKVENFGTDKAPIPVITTKKHEEHIFASSNLWGVVGSDEIYNDFIKINNFSLSDNALVFLEQKPNLTKKIRDSFGKILLYKKKDMDLKGSMIDVSDLISPSQILDYNPDLSGWWKRRASDLISWRSFLQEKYGIDNLDFDYGKDWAVAEGKLKLDLKNLKIKSGDILLARVMKSTKGGKISFFEGSNVVGIVNTKINKPEKTIISLTGKSLVKQFEYDRSDFEWLEVGSLKDGSEITMVAEGGLNVVNLIAVVSQNEWDSIEKNVDQMRVEGRVLEWDRLGEEREKYFRRANVPQIAYEAISPTQYNLKLRGVSSSVVVSFSESYDPKWEMNGQNSLPLYSLINGFVVNGDGNYKIAFAPQRYVNFGLIITMVSFFAVILLILIL